jgi:hypothetical protein
VRKITWILFLLIIGYSSFAQDAKPATNKDARFEKKKKRREKINALIKQEEEGALVFHKQNTFGLRVNTDGYSMFFEKGWMQTSRKASFLCFELGEKKHPKEHKASTSDNAAFFVSNTPFVYGKKNIFYQFKISAGQQLVLGYRGNKNGVSVTGIYGGGISVGLLRPYYLRVQRGANNNEVVDIKYSSADSLDFLGNSIIEGTGLKHGWNELKFSPGLHARAGLRFDYGRYNELVSAVEVGINAEYYFSKPEIMLLTKNKQFLLSAYASINFGRRK